MLKLGLESGYQSMLEAMNKGQYLANFFIYFDKSSDDYI